jgi:cell division protein FtsW
VTTIIWLVVMVLFVFSMLAVYSASSSLAFKSADGNSSHYLYKQIVSAIGGSILMYLAHMVDYRYFSRIAQIYIPSACLPHLHHVLGYEYQSCQSPGSDDRSIGWTFQTSDLAKLAVIMLLARMLSKNQESMNDFKKTVLPMLGVVSDPVLIDREG